MSLVQDLYAGLKKIVTIEDRIVRLADDVKRLQLDVAGHGERLARLVRKVRAARGHGPCPPPETAGIRSGRSRWLGPI